MFRQTVTLPYFSSGVEVPATPLPPLTARIGPDGQVVISHDPVVSQSQALAVQTTPPINWKPILVIAAIALLLSK